MSQIPGTGWLNANLMRNYPLSQSATLDSYNSGMTIPDDLFVDMKLHVPFIETLSPVGFHISSITVYPQGMTFAIGYSHNGLTIPVVAVSDPVTFTGFSEYSTVRVRGVTTGGYEFSQCFGMAVIGRVSSIQGLFGTSDFNVTAGRLEACVISFGAARISGLRVASSSGITQVLSGQITLESGSNHVINSLQVLGQGFKLQLNAVDGSGLSEECDCSGIELAPCIRTINNVPADALGNINLVGGDCVQVQPSDTGISISDSCAKPCCGCNELQVIVEDVEAMKTLQNQLTTQIGILGGGINGLQQSCLGSSLDPSSCAEDGA